MTVYLAWTWVPWKAVDGPEADGVSTPEESRMAEISFLEGDSRLVVHGECLTADCDVIVEAIEVFAGLVDPLVLDFTGSLPSPWRSARR